MSWRARHLVSVSAIVVVICALLPAAAAAQTDNARGIEGTWFVQITTRNCADGTVTGQLFALNTFLAGGAMFGTPAAPVGALRTGHGVWSHVGGSSYFNRNGLFFYNPQTGAFGGLLVVTRQITLSPGGNEFTSSDTDVLYDPATFAPLRAPQCATGVGRRVPQ